jgi:hypothetical protein
VNDSGLPLRNGRYGPLAAGLGGGLGALLGYGTPWPGVGGAILAGVGGGLGALVGLYADARLA